MFITSLPTAQIFLVVPVSSEIPTPARIWAAHRLFVGGYSRSSSFDTRLRLALEILGVPYTMVTGFPATAEINKAMMENEVNFSGSSLPGYQTQVVPQIVKTGIGIPVFQYSIIGPNGPTGNPKLTAEGVPTFDELYR